MNLEELLKIIVCPQTKQPLRLAEFSELKSINDQINLGQVIYLNGKLANRILEGLLITLDNDWGYPILEGIPILLKENAIALRK